MEEQGRFLTGFLWGTSLSIPLWIAFFGWIKIMISLL